MTQEIVVLRCKECLTFQTHVSKKSIKYNCKLCGEKQSISRIYQKGTGAECRRICQRLNTAVPFDGDSDDVDRELDRYEDEVHQSKVKSLKRSSSSPDQPDSDEMLANEEDFESDTQTDTQTDSPASDGARDEGFEERNLIRDVSVGQTDERAIVADNLSQTVISSSSAGYETAVSSTTDPSPPVAKKNRYSLFQ